MLVETASYVSRILTMPDPTLGRSGAVCPFVGAALLADMITLSVLPLRTADASALGRAALAISDAFATVDGRTPSRSESLRAVIILLPLLRAEDAAQAIVTVQQALKPEMVENGLMIGEFFPGCTAPGLNNPAFRPADTAVAFLAIRRLTAADLPFLIEDAGLVESYLARFGDEGRRRLSKLRPEADSLPDQGELQASLVAQSALSGSIDHYLIHAG